MRNRTGLFLLGITIFVSNFSGESVTTIHKTVTQVSLTLVATDQRGRTLPVLSPADIAVLENGQPVPNFQLRPADNYPLRLGIMLDLSDSTRKTWPRMKPLIDKFLQQLIHPPDRMLLVAFDTKVEMERLFSEPQQAAAMIPQLQGGGPTALFDAIYSTCQHPLFRDREPNRSALIVFSDGEDTLSLRDVDQAIAAAQSNGIAVYTVSVHRRREETPGDRVLRKLAEATGGRDFVVKEERQTQAALSTIATDLRAYYLLYYTPVKNSGSREFRHVRVVPTGESGPILRYRDGYYTVPVAGDR